MQANKLRTGVVCIAVVLLTAGCSTSKPAPVTVDGLRPIIGTSLIGARGATSGDQSKIDETVAGLCGSSVWTKSECARHGSETK